MQYNWDYYNTCFMSIIIKLGEQNKGKLIQGKWTQVKHVIRANRPDTVMTLLTPGPKFGCLYRDSLNHDLNTPLLRSPLMNMSGSATVVCSCSLPSLLPICTLQVGISQLFTAFFYSILCWIRRCLYFYEFMIFLNEMYFCD